MKQNKIKSTAISMTNKFFRKITINNKLKNSGRYAKRIKNIIFAMIYIKSNMSYALFKFSQFMSNPGKTHDVAAKQTLRYFRSTFQLRMKYNPIKTDNHEVAKIYCDFDYAKDLNNRRFVLNHVVMLKKKAVSWFNKRQKSVFTSTIEAKYMILSSTIKQIL